ARSSRPSCQPSECLRLRVTRPPHGWRALIREQKIHVSKRLFIDALRLLPPGLAKLHGESFRRAHCKPPRLRDAPWLRIEANATFTVDDLQHSEWKGHNASPRKIGA